MDKIPIKSSCESCNAKPDCNIFEAHKDNEFYCSYFKAKSFKPSFQKITILYGEAASGKTHEAKRIYEGKKTLKIYLNNAPVNKVNAYKCQEFDIIIFDGLTSIKNIKKIMKLNLPVKEIIICIQKS